MREQLALPDWAERYRYITQGPLVGASGAPVRWSNETFPLQRAVMEAIEDPRWHRVAVMACPQAGGKTDCAAINPILKAIQHDLTDSIYVSANATKAYDQWQKKFEPAIRASRVLRELIPWNRDDGGDKTRRDFTNGCSIFFAGAESIANLSGSTIPVIVCDDVQGMPASLGELAHPVDVAFTRSRALPEDERRHVLLGTAGTVDNYLWREIEASAHFKPYLPCPACGRYQLLEWDRMQFDERDAVVALSDCWLRCVNTDCTYQIHDDDLPGMLQGVKWVARGQSVDEDGNIVGPLPATRAAGFWWNALYWPFTGWGAFAAEWVESRGDPEKEKNFQQHVLVIPYEEPKIDEDALDPAQIKAHALESHRWGLIPAAAGVQGKDGVVIVTADVQAGYIWYLVCAWLKAMGTCWLIEAGRYGSAVKAADEPSREGRKDLWKSRVHRALEKLWIKDSAGWDIVAPGGEVAGHAQASLCPVDCSFLRDTVQTSCVRFNGGRQLGKWIPLEGSQAKARSTIPVWPGANKAKRERQTNRFYYECNTNRAKLYVRDILAIPPGQPGSLILPYDMPPFIHDAFAKQLCSEEWDGARGTWKLVSRANHLLDCMAEQVVGAMAMGVRLPVVADAIQVVQRERPRVRAGMRMPNGEPFLVTER